MNIALIYDAVFPWVKGGVERRVYEIGRRLARDGHEVHLYGMHYWDGPAVREEEGMVLHGVCRPFRLYHGGRRSILQGILFGIAVLPALLRGHHDLADCEQFPYFSCIAAWIAGKARRRPLVITWHEVWDRYWLRYLGLPGILGLGIEWIVSRLTPAPVAVSAMTADRLGRIRGSGPARVIPNGVDPEAIASVPAFSGFPEVLFAGRLIPEKHVDLLLQALSLVRAEKPGVCAAVIGDGPECDRLRQLAQSLGLGEAVRFVSFLPSPDDIFSRMKGSRVFVLPSSREGFGMVALEAMACGTPVVTTSSPDNAARDLVTQATGRVVPPSPGAIARGIIECLDHHDEMVPQCREYAALMNWDRITADTRDYYESVIHSSRRT